MTAHELFLEMIRSVERRGFHHPTAYTPTAADPILTMQTFRLLEEAGEVARALRKNQPENALIELADLIIVAQNLAHRLHPGLGLDMLIQAKLATDELARGQLHGDNLTPTNQPPLSSFGRGAGGEGKITPTDNAIADDEHIIYPKE